MDTKKKKTTKTAEVKKAPTIATKKLFLKEFHYEIEDSDVVVNIIFDVGLLYEDEKGKQRQFPIIKMTFERKWNFDGMSVTQVTQAMLNGNRPIKKIISTEGRSINWDGSPCTSWAQVLGILQSEFTEVCAPIFGFNIDLSCLKGSQIEFIFNQAVSGQQVQYSAIVW